MRKVLEGIDENEEAEENILTSTMSAKKPGIKYELYPTHTNQPTKINTIKRKMRTTTR